MGGPTRRVGAGPVQSKTNHTSIIHLSFNTLSTGPSLAFLFLVLSSRTLASEYENCKFLGFSTLSTMSQLSSNCIAVKDKVVLHTTTPFACVQVALFKESELQAVEDLLLEWGLAL